jgi:hypothetical protein
VHLSGRRLGVGISLLSWPLALAGVAGADPPAAGSLQLHAAEIDIASLTPLTRAAMQHELGTLLEPASLAVAWRTVRPGAETEPDELSFVFLSSKGVGPDRGALASTANRGLVRTTWVYLPSVAATLGLGLEAVATSFDAQRLIGVALGRVLAHEMVHAMAPDVEHARVGLMRSRLRVFQLVRGRPALADDCVASLAAGARLWLAGRPEHLDVARAATAP